MSEVLRELVVALSLDSDNFARNLRTINKQIKEAESTFNLASAGVDKFEKTIQGAESKLSMLGSKLTQQNRAVEQYSRALVAANQKLTDSYARQERMKAALEDARAEYQRIGQQVTSASEKYKEYARTLGETDSATIAAGQNLDRLKEEHKAAGDAVKKLEGQITANSKTLQNNADAIATATANLNNAKAAVKTTEAEIKKLTEELYRMQSKWTQAGTALTAFSKKCETVSKADFHQRFLAGFAAAALNMPDEGCRHFGLLCQPLLRLPQLPPTFANLSAHVLIIHCRTSSNHSPNSCPLVAFYHINGKSISQRHSVNLFMARLLR